MGEVFANSFFWILRRFLGFEDCGCVAQGFLVHIATRVVSFSSLLFGQSADAVLKVLEGAQIPGLNVLRVLDCDNVFPSKLLVADKVAPHLRFDIEPFDCIVRKDIAGDLQSNNMGVVRKNLEGHWIHHLPFIILVEMELYQLIRSQRLSSDRIRAMFLQPWENIGNVENGPINGADRMGKRLQGDGAEIIW